MRQDLLKAFIVQYPVVIDYEIKDYDQFKRNMYKAFYYAITNDGEYLEELFNNISDTEVMELVDYKFDLSDATTPFYMNVNDNLYTHPQGSVCARPLKQGEPVYRCDQCGLDSTCVMCVHCYNPSAHEGHDVQMYISNSEGGGICDCGDPEAFQGNLDCKCQKFVPVSEELPPLFQNSIKVTLRILLDYILDVTNFSITSLPFIHDNINCGDNLLTSETISNISSLPANKYGVQDTNSSQLWYLILWNDEYHNFVEATDAISAAIHVDHMRAHEIASDVNVNGRCVLKTSSTPLGLYTALDAAESNGLVASIVSARDYIREEIVHQAVAWIHNIMNFTCHFGFRDLVRSTLAELLLESDYTFIKYLPSTLLDSLSINVSRRCFENSLLLNGKIVNYGFSKLPNVSVQQLAKPATQVLELPNEKFFNSRLQFLMLFSIRFKTSVRKLLSQLIIPPVVSSQGFKSIFCQQYIQIYPHLLTATALSDREDHLNLLSDVSSQIMTCPTSVQWILESGSIGHLLGPMAQLIEEHTSKWNYDTGYPNFYERVIEDRIGKERSVYESIFRALHDLTYVSEPNFSQHALKEFFKKDNFGLLILVLRTFQDYWPIERKYGDHVEREIMDFVIHLRYSIPILKVTKQIAECYCDDQSIVASVIKYLINYLLLRKVDQKALGIANFRVSKDPVSFVHPLNSFLSYIIQNNDFESFINIFKGMNKPFMNVSDISLRSIVLASQVRIGFWIRNGISVSRQASLYLDTALVDSAYKRDMHLQQIALLFDDPGTTLYNFLDRWELFEWFINEVSFDKTIYEDRFGSLVERFIIFLYNIFTDRTAFIPMSIHERSNNDTKNLIIYSLSSGPKSYSDIKDYIENDLTDDSRFDKCLSECADYQAPTSMIDSGMYRLKPEVYMDLDPYSIYLDPSQSQEVIDAIIKQKMKIQNIEEKEVDIIPKFIMATDYVNQNIGKFTRTSYFAKMVYKLLQVALDTGEETYIGPLLQLIHAVLMDYEVIEGKNHIPSNLVDIPISDLLLNIVESSMSKIYISKADRLLNHFISNDERVKEGLIDCFGQEHVEQFLSTRNGISESEAEKKKRLASQRNAKVMKKFAKQRKKFLAKNDDLTDQFNEEVETKHIKQRTCVLCGEPETPDAVFGTLSSVLSPTIFWKLPVQDPKMVSCAFENVNPNQMIVDDNKEYGPGYHYSSYKKLDVAQSLGLSELIVLEHEKDIVFSCGHGMHYRCYKQSTDRTVHFSCPLCHTIQNIFIPSYLPPSVSKPLDREMLDGEARNDSYSKILYSGSIIKSRYLIEHYLNKSDPGDLFRNVKGRLEVFVMDSNLKFKKTTFLKGATPKVKYFNLLQSLLTTIADTIRMHEISSRIKPTDSNSNFLDTLNGSNKSLLKSLIQTRALLFEMKGLPLLLGKNHDLSEEIERFWQSDYLIEDVFNEVVILFFQTDESFVTLAKVCMIKLFTLCFHSFIIRCEKDIGFKQRMFELIRVEDQLIISSLIELFTFTNIDVSDSFIEVLPSFYGFVIQFMFPFIRQLILFKDLLTSTDEGDNVHTSVEELQNLNTEMMFGKYSIQKLNKLCYLVGLPTLDDLIIALSDKQSFEFKTFDNVSTAKIPKYFESGILVLEYPGTIKLIDLPQNYGDCLSNMKASKKGTYDNYICLHCGMELTIRSFLKHMRKCSYNTCIFFHPSKNTLRVVTHIGTGEVSLLLPGPYLTIHGEVKDAKTTTKAYLNEFRYNELARQWINQEFYALVTRTLYGSRQSTDFRTNNLAVDEESSEDEDEDIFNFPNIFAV